MYNITMGAEKKKEQGEGWKWFRRSQRSMGGTLGGWKPALKDTPENREFVRKMSKWITNGHRD